MTRFLISIISILLAMSCVQNKYEMTCSEVREQEVPPGLIYFEKKAKLRDIRQSNFELRVWGYKLFDSMPGTLMRFYLDKGKLNVAYYSFTNMDSISVIKKKDVLTGNFLVSGQDVFKLPDNILDSLRTTYNISRISEFNTDFIRKRQSEIRDFDKTVGYILIQEVNEGYCHEAYIRLPYYIEKDYDSFPEFKAYAQYKNLFKFIERSVDPIVVKNIQKRR